MNTWQLQDAKANLSKVVKEASLHGPQKISLRGEPVVVILSMKDYEKLAHPKPTFLELMRNSPLVGAKIRVTRLKSSTRKVVL